MENTNVPIDDVVENVVEETFSFTLLQEEEDQESDFEFGCVTPDSPTTDSNKNSPADLLFFNGRLQPHVFPAFHHQSSKEGIMSSSSTTSRSSTNCSTPTSRTTSICTSKESYSFTSSRSTSCNSRSSCSSTSTSTLTSSTSSPINVAAAITKTTIVEGLDSIKKLDRFQPCLNPIERPRWYFIRPAPVLMSSVPEVARRKKTDSKSKKQIKKKKKKRKWSRVKSWFGWRYFRSIVWACKACHALEPSSTQ